VKRLKYTGEMPGVVVPGHGLFERGVAADVDDALADALIAQAPQEFVVETPHFSTDESGRRRRPAVK